MSRAVGRPGCRPMQNVEFLETLGISLSLIAARALQPCAEAEHLTVAEVDHDGMEHRLTPGAASAWGRLKQAAHDEGISIFIVSSFRSIDRQVTIIRRKLAAGQKIEDILQVSAPPGFSEHHTGRAVDIGTVGSPPLSVQFDQTPAFVWLSQHAENFGFKLSYPVGNAEGYQYEPWHWCYIAQQNAPADRPTAAQSFGG